MRLRHTRTQLTGSAILIVGVLTACSSADDGATSTDSVTESAPVTEAADATSAEPSATAAAPATEAPEETVVDSTEAPAPASTAPPQQGWSKFVPDAEGCACSDGSEFALFERPGDPSKVMFYFEGGGACFSAETCGPTAPTFTPTITQTVDDLAERTGLFDSTNPENPLADYSIVYVPYCTGDVHLGNATTEYSPEITIEHRGYLNAQAALDYLVATYPDTEQLVVTGASAGSVPTPLMAGLASDLLPTASIVTLGDSSGAYPDVPTVNEIIGNLWGTSNAVPDWPENEGMTPAEWSFPGLYIQAGEHAPDITFARFDHAFDDVQATFGALAGVAGDDLVSLIDETENQVEAAGIPLASYVAPGTSHTIIGGDDVYELEVEGVRLIDWITELVDGSVPADVHCADCTGS